MTVDEAVIVAVIHTLSIKHGIAVSEAAEAASILAAEVRHLRSEIDSAREELQSFVDARNEWKQRAEVAEAALKEAQEQPAVPEMTDDALEEILNAAQIVGYDDPLRIVRGFVMRVLQEWGNQEGMHKAFLDAVKPAVAAPAVPEEWRDVITELADDLSIELDQRYGDSRKYPSEQRKYEAEMQPVYRARALLQSTGDKK